MGNVIHGSKSITRTPMGSRVEVSSSTPFANKTLPDGKKVYKRVHGVSETLQSGQTNIDFVIPHDACKITGVEIIAGIHGDKVNFKVYDTPTGTISGYPDVLLNQFGFNVYMAEGLHKELSNYDADLIKDMKVSLEYDAKDTGAEREVYVNFILHEVK